jgi:hypothetical protein
MSDGGPLPLRADKRLYFLHIPKTAGTTVKALLDSHFDQDEIYPAELWRQLVKLPWDELPGHRLFRGHFGGGGLLPLLPEPPVTITFLRRTVPLVVSTYRFILREPNTRMHRIVKDLTFKQYVDDPRTRKNISNPQVRNLAFSLPGDPRPELALVDEQAPWDIAVRMESLSLTFSHEERLALALERLRGMACFGLTDRFDESMALLAYTLGWPPAGAVQRLMVAPGTIPKPEITPEIARKIESFNTLDMNLLDEAERLFQARVDAMLADLARLTQPGERAPETIGGDPELCAILLDRHYERCQAQRRIPRVERVTVDFARALDGSGWHGRERTGFDASIFRWTGPQSVSTVDLPLAPGTDYALEFRVLNASAPDVLESLRLSVSDTDVPLEIVDGRHGVVRLYRGRIPARCIHTERPFTRLALHVARTASKQALDPSDPDDRPVGVAVHWIRVEALPAPGPAAPEGDRRPRAAPSLLGKVRGSTLLRRLLRVPPPGPSSGPPLQRFPHSGRED